MNKLLTFAFLFIVSTAFSQITTPAPSPSAKFEQTVGLTTVSVEYSRPGMKGRTIFAEDGLVPYGKIWRTGANAATKMTFSDDVTINGQELKGGAYAVLTKPSKDSWDFHFYPYEGRSFGSYVEKEPALVTTSEVRMADWAMETFTIGTGELTTTSANFHFMWENTRVTIVIGVNVDDQVMANIDRVMAGPSQNDYFNAASYYHEAGKDLNQAYKWICKATDVDSPRFWQVRRKALIEADMGKKAEAIKTAEMSMKLAMEAGNDDYVALNKKSIAEWTKE